jgi:hypothetical protein
MSVRRGTNIIRGSPIRAGERWLVPVVRMSAYVRRRVLVGSERLAGHGRGFVHLQPVAVLEQDEEGERLIPIHDRTTQMLRGLLLGAIVVPLVAAVVVRAVRKRHSGSVEV